MATIFNGGPLLVGLFILALIIVAALYHRARFECALVDRTGFRCGARFGLRTSYEEHLTLCHDVPEEQARKLVTDPSS